MFKLLLLSSLFISQMAQAYIVISDVDDTLKITNSGSSVQAGWNGLFKKDVFAAMPELFKAWSDDGAKIYLVTASPKLVKHKMLELLRYHHIQYESLTLKSNLFESKLKYKVRELSRILDLNPQEDAVLIGDDVGQDPEIFEAIEQKYGKRILVKYVRPVKNRSLFAGDIPYITAFDIASEESMSGRLLADGDSNSTPDTLEKIAAVISQANASKVIPVFAWCPSDLSTTGLPTESSPYSIAQDVEDKVESLCRERQSAF
ncbi:MAG: DUF2183 domain-containing protein [Bacteriovoracaceae bacterium]|nr:DUF2183 domain-containing protein [Bacteriovoracaceae bacterium]